MNQKKHKDNKYYNSSDKREISSDDLESLKLLAIQIEGMKIGVTGYILLFISTMQGIELILAKYNSESNLENNVKSSAQPDFIALQSTYIFFIERLIFIYVALTRYDIVYNKSLAGDFPYSLEPNIFINTANLLSILAGIYFILGAEGIYARDNVQPVFGV